MLHDRFYARWAQPIALLQEGGDLSALLEIKIDRSGRIIDVNLSRSSGNATMDGSIMTAARQILKVDPLPKGLGTSGGYTVNIAFKLSP